MCGRGFGRISEERPDGTHPKPGISAQLPDVEILPFHYSPIPFVIFYFLCRVRGYAPTLLRPLPGLFSFSHPEPYHRPCLYAQFQSARRAAIITSTPPHRLLSSPGQPANDIDLSIFPINKKLHSRPLALSPFGHRQWSKINSRHHPTATESIFWASARAPSAFSPLSLRTPSSPSRRRPSDTA